MLPAANRLTGAAGFQHAVRRGRRSGSRTLVVHRAAAAGPAPAAAPLVGFVVSRAVGNAVVRNRVRRRLRHLVRDRLDRLSQGEVVVVRALPASAAASYDDLARDLGRGLGTSTAVGA